MGKWISVKDRLPDNGKEVWVMLNNDTCYHGKYPNAYYDSGTWHYMNDVSIDDDYYDVHVTHWMEIEELKGD